MKLAITAIFVATITMASNTAQAQWADPYTYDVGDLVDPADCDSDGCALDNVLATIIASCEANVSGFPVTSNRYATGCRIIIPPGDHTLDTTLSFCRAYSIEGGGGTANRRPLTNIFVTKDVFIGRGFQDCRDTGEGQGGAISLTGLGLVAPPGAHAVPIVAIRAAAPVNIDNVWASYFDVSLVIAASVNYSPPSNANVFYVNRFTTEYSQHSGIIIEGGDASAGTLSSLNVNTACWGVTAALEAKFGNCTGLLDSSFLGSFVSNSHFDIKAGYPDFTFEGLNNRGTCMGCYVEGPDAPILSNLSMWLGGIGPTPAGLGLRIEGTNASGLSVKNDTDPANVVTVVMGNATGQGGVFYALTHSGLGASWPFRMKWLPATTQYLEDVANSAFGKVRSIVGYHTGNYQVLGETYRYDDVTPLSCDEVVACYPEP